MKFTSTVLFLMITLGSFSQMNQVDAKGKKQGEWGKTYPRSIVYQYRGQFKDDKPVGTFTYFYPNKKVKAVVKHDANSNRSVANMYHDNGEIMSIGIYINGKKDSVWMNFGPSGRLSNTETYKADSLHGKKVVYYVPEDVYDKRRIVLGEYNYVNGTMDGPIKEYFDNGVIKQTGAYVNGRRQGEWITYQPGGQKLMLSRYKNGIKHGWFLAYDDSGKEINRMYFYNGEEYKGERLKLLMSNLKAKGVNPND